MKSLPRVVLCVRGYLRLMELLANALPDLEVVDCVPDEVVAAAAEADVLIPLVTRIPDAALRAPRLRLIQQYGVGLDGVDLARATEHGVLVANVPSVGTGNAESVAEIAIAHMLMLMRDLPLAQQRFRERKVGSPLSRSLWRSTVLILGYGDIGQEIARRLNGFGVRILAVSRRGPEAERARDPAVIPDLHVSLAELPAIAGLADIVVVAAPATPENISFVDAALLAAFRRGVFIVNIARGAVIDYEALRAALESGQVAGAGLDVFWQEPFDPGDPILRSNVIATPHIGGVTERSLEGISQAVVDNIRRVLRGELPLHCANPHAGTHPRHRSS